MKRPGAFAPGLFGFPKPTVAGPVPPLARRLERLAHLGKILDMQLDDQSGGGVGIDGERIEARSALDVALGIDGPSFGVGL